MKADFEKRERILALEPQILFNMPLWLQLFGSYLPEVPANANSPQYITLAGVIDRKGSDDLRWTDLNRTITPIPLKDGRIAFGPLYWTKKVGIELEKIPGERAAGLESVAEITLDELNNLVLAAF
ncbi:MAG: hypothetical protein HC836_27755 [Richelia sp. RM2_1_2]|nr:hypothetical protein [Richelia sp. RM2_1_2]